MPPNKGMELTVQKTQTRLMPKPLADDERR